MYLFLNLISSTNSDVVNINLTTSNENTLKLNELDFIDLEIESREKLDLDKCIFSVGNTSFKIEESNYLNGNHFYRLNLENLKQYLPGGKNEAHISKGYHATQSGNRQFYRLFINEIGISNIQLLYNDIIYSLGKLSISSSKIVESDYEIITKYLIFNSYFDSNHFYKVAFEGNKNDIEVSLLESIKELNQYLQEWVKSVENFKIHPIFKVQDLDSIVKYESLTNIDDNSISWLIENLDELNFSNTFENNTLVLGITRFSIDKIRSTIPNKSFDTYENRIIHGFLDRLIYLLNEYSILLEQRSLRIRIDNFKQYLLECFNSIIQTYLLDAKNKTLYLKDFFIKNLPVIKKDYSFPSKTNSFITKPHYNLVLDLMVFTKNVFSKGLNDPTDFKIEIESFDKLFEVYVFYLIKDTLEFEFCNSQFLFTPNTQLNNNKLAGKYSLQNQDYSLNIYYENLPSSFIQFTKYNYNPDFVIEYIKNNKKQYLILDAKFKKYFDSRIEQIDLSDLSFKYLHKIGHMDESHKILGLFSISLSDINTVKSLFRNGYNLESLEPTLPQIGSILIDPKKFNIKSSGLKKVFSFFLNN